MSATATFVGTGLQGSSDRGQKFACPDCQAEVLIRSPGSVFMGLVYCLFWDVVGVWALIQGPLWYITHLSHFQGDYRVSFFVLDGGVILLSLGAAALGIWTTWAFLVAPVWEKLRNPVIGQTRQKTGAETRQSSLDIRNALLGFFVLPLGFWLPVIGAGFAVDALAISVDTDGAMKYVFIGIPLVAFFWLTRWLGLNIYYTFVGLVFWLALIVGAIFAWA